MNKTTLHRKKSLFAILTLVCVLAMALFAVACSKENDPASSGFAITGRPTNDTVTITDTSNTLTLGCGEAGATWTSSDTAVATVDGGVVTLLSAGSTVIGATKGNRSDSFILTVVDERTPSDVTVTISGAPQNNEVLLSSGTLQLSATCSDGGELVWLSRNEALATVDGTGKVTLLKRGTVEIVAQKKGVSNVFGVLTLRILAGTVTAIDSITGISASGQVGVGQTVRLTFATQPEDCEPFAVDWEVADPTVVRINENSELTGLKVGTTTVTATVPGTQISASKEITVVETNENYEDFSTAVVIGNYIVGEIEIRDAGNVLSPEIVHDTGEDNYYLKYSHKKANGNNRYMVYSFTGLETGARYVLEYRMKVLSYETSYSHQINLYSDIDVPVVLNDPLVGNVYSWHTTGLNTETAKIYQSGGNALYRDGVRRNGDPSDDDFHVYTLGFLAGESTVGFAFVNNNTFEALFDYICVKKAPEVEEFELSAPGVLTVGRTAKRTATAKGDLVYYQPFSLTWSSSDPAVATIDPQDGTLTAVSEGTVTITANDGKGHNETAEIRILESVDKTLYDIFYDDTDPSLTAPGGYLTFNYVLPEKFTSDAKQGDSYIVTLEVDAIYYTGNVQWYVGLFNKENHESNINNLIGQMNWTTDNFPASGEKKTVPLRISLPWASGDFSVVQLRIGLFKGITFQVGINVVSIEKYVPEPDPDAGNYDIFFDGDGWSAETFHEFSEPITGGAYNQTYEITFEIVFKSVHQPEASQPNPSYFGALVYSLYNAEGQRISNSNSVAGCEGNGQITAMKFEGSGTFTYTGKFQFTNGITGGYDVSKIGVTVNGRYYKAGINITIVPDEPEEPEPDPDFDPEEYDFAFEGSGQVVQNKPYTDWVDEGARKGDWYDVTLEVDAVAYTGTVSVYLGLFNKINTTNTDGLIGQAEWVSVADFPAAGEKKNVTLRIKLPWASGDFGIKQVRLGVKGGSDYKIGVNVVSIVYVTAFDKLEYNVGFVRNEAGTEDEKQNYSVDKVEAGARAGDSYNVALEIDAAYYQSDLQFYIELRNANGDPIGVRDWTAEKFPASGAAKQTVTFTVLLTGEYADYDVLSVLLGVRSSGKYRIGINVGSIVLTPVFHEEDYDIVFDGNSWSVETFYELDTPVTGGVYQQSFTISFEVTFKSGSLAFIYFAAYNSTGTAITNSEGINGIGNGRLTEVSAGSGTYTYTATIKWNQPSGLDISKVGLTVNGTNYTVGINITVALIELEEPEPDPDEDNYHIFFDGDGWSAETFYEFPEAITGGAYNQTYEITFEIVFKSVHQPEASQPNPSYFGALVYSLYNAEGQRISNSNSVAGYEGNGQITAMKFEGSGTFTYTGKFQFTNGITGGYDISKIGITVNGRFYKAGINVSIVVDSAA